MGYVVTLSAVDPHPAEPAMAPGVRYLAIRPGLHGHPAWPTRAPCARYLATPRALHGYPAGVALQETQTRQRTQPAQTKAPPAVAAVGYSAPA